jgi:signal transduction histidine kinase
MTSPLIPTETLTHGTELNAVYAIARIVAETFDTESGLDAVFRLARTIFIFDTVALYLYDEDSEQLEPHYARALGRGRSRGAELAWGEQAAQEAFRTGQTTLRQEDAGASIKERDRRRDYLGLPLLVAGRCVGSLVFGRFGGPSYPAEHIRLAEFVAWHVGQLLENRRMARRIATLEAQRELARMQDEFISTISHELRTPLGFIKGYVTTLLRDDTSWDEEEREEFLRIIDDEADRLRELIDNLLDSSRLESGSLSMTLEPAPLGPVIRDSVQRLEGAHPEVQIELEMAEELPRVRLDPTRIAQVLDNMLNNAHKYAPGSPVTVRVLAKPDRMRIEVVDRGPGIPPEHTAHLFERFFRMPQSSTIRGTGLGLYISRKIIEAHGGEIGVDSQPGEQTTFFFELPLETDAAGVQESPDA